MESAKLTVRLPKRDLEFAKQYAQAHKISVTELINRYLRFLRASEESRVNPEVERIAGLIPADVNTESEFREHVLRKYR